MSIFNRIEQLQINRNKTFLKTQYLRILQRDPDKDGFDYFLSKLNSFKLRRRDIIRILKSSEEYRSLKENPDKYLYQRRSEITFDQGVTLLRKRLKNNISTDAINYLDPNVVRRICDELIKLGISVDTLKVNREEYKDYLKIAGYKGKYPDYYPDNFYEKSFEHFLCYKFLNLKRGDNFVDIANLNGLQRLFSRYYVSSWYQ